jgi:predicted dehydrogenase
MKAYNFVGLALTLAGASVLAALMAGVGSAGATGATAQAGDAARFRLITLDPGHFHAALVQKSMYPDVSPVVHVYAPEGDELKGHLARIESFNTRADDPTRWDLRVYRGPDFFERMLQDRAGNIVVISGNNARKTEYIVRSIEAGFNVLADKPMARTPQDVERLKHAFEVARQKGVLLYDIMTERFEITTILQRELSRHADLFGQLQRGTVDEPAITKESVHHFSKTVAGAPLVRPPWFFDVEQQGEGIVDVTTHLVDLIQWTVLPNESLAPADATVLQARRWTTPVTREQFTKVTGAQQFPEYLKRDVRDGVLHVYSNGAFTYRLRDVHARVSVTWDYEAPPGAGDTHYSIMRGTRANLVIRQGKEQQFKPVLYIERAADTPQAAHEAAVQAAVQSLQDRYPGVEAKREGERFVVHVPAKYSLGHEAHFGQVTANYLRYLREGALPAWEVPGMITKYATIMQAYERSRQAGTAPTAAR